MIRYYCDDGKTILFHKYFHLQSLVKDLVPVIKEYFASEQYKTGKPIPGKTIFFWFNEDHYNYELIPFGNFSQLNAICIYP